MGHKVQNLPAMVYTATIVYVSTQRPMSFLLYAVLSSYRWQDMSGHPPPLTLMGCRPLLRISHSIFLQIRHFLKASRGMSSEPNQKEYMLILASSSIPPWTQTITHTCIPGRSKLPKFPLTHTQEGGQRWGGELPLLTPSLSDSQVTT